MVFKVLQNLKIYLAGVTDKLKNVLNKSNQKRKGEKFYCVKPGKALESLILVMLSRHDLSDNAIDNASQSNATETLRTKNLLQQTFL